jgi:hypothetical protein
MNEFDKNTNTKKRRHCHFNSEWEKDYNWLRAVKDNNDEAKCLICSTTFTTKWDGLNAIKSHMKSTQHQKKATNAQQQTLKNFFVSGSADEKGKRAVALAEITNVYHANQHHHSYLSMDCGVKLARRVYTDSDIAKKMACGRTKAVAISENVLAPYSVELLLNELGTSFFSIASDASNKGNRKFFPLCVRYFNPAVGVQDRVLDFSTKMLKKHPSQYTRKSGLI